MAHTHLAEAQLATNERRRPVAEHLRLSRHREGGIEDFEDILRGGDSIRGRVIVRSHLAQRQECLRY